MKVAVLSLTRDRLAYSQHCFATLHEFAGCDYEHHVLDQGSQDDTPRWLKNGTFDGVYLLRENIGCCRGWNYLLEQCDPAGFDVVVTIDNDAELVQPDTLKVVASLAAEHEVILSPRVQGLLNPPSTIGQFRLGEYTIDETRIIGNIFMAIPSPLLVRDGFRWDESRFSAPEGGESITQWFRDRGGRCGYVQGFEVWHYETTQGQIERYPEYWARKRVEMGLA